MKPMGKSRSILGFVLLLVWMAAPTLRCLVPGEALTAAEQACCKAMAGQCGNSAPSSSDHPCCKHTISNSQPALVTASAQVSANTYAVAAGILPLVATSAEPGFAPAWLVDTSPPPMLAEASSILRI